MVLFGAALLLISIGALFRLILIEFDALLARDHDGRLIVKMLDHNICI